MGAVLARFSFLFLHSVSDGSFPRYFLSPPRTIGEKGESIALPSVTFLSFLWPDAF